MPERGSLSDTYVAALQHDLATIPDDATLVGVVRRPTAWFVGSVDENHPDLGPPGDLLDEVKERAGEFEREGMDDAAAAHAAWKDTDFESRYRRYLHTDPDARRAVRDLAERLKAGEDLVLVCYENTDEKPCHRTILEERLRARLQPPRFPEAEAERAADAGAAAAESDRTALTFLATTNPGLESVAIEEVRELLGVEAEYRYRGTISFEADERALYELNYRSRTLHRVGLLLVDEPIDGVDDLGALVESLPVEDYLAEDQAFAVRATRHGEHDFSSMDVADATGQAVIDAYRSATGHRLPVDLDDPDAIFRAFVRDDRFFFALDTTGEESLHRRRYRVCEHNSPLRPTIAASMVRLANYRPGDRLLDPMCGSATIPTEAALWALGDPPGAYRDGFAFQDLPFLDDDFEAIRQGPVPRHEQPPEPGVLRGTIRARDESERWIRCARENLRAAGVDGVVDLGRADAREEPVDCDVVVSNLPFGIRTPVDLKDLYGAFSERLAEGEWRRAVLLTTSPEHLDLPTETEIEVRYGRLQASIVVAER